MENWMLGWSLSSARTRLVLPAPEGAVTRNRRPRLLKVLHLFPHLLDEHFQVHHLLGDGRILGLRTQGVGLPVELLHEEIQPPAHGLAALEGVVEFLEMAAETVQLLGHV